MTHRPTFGLFVATLAYFFSDGTSTQQPVPTHDDVAAVEEFLFVQNSTAGTYDGERLTLESVAPTIFFSDRPFRVFGHVQLGAFIEAWSRGPNSFAEDPPNAILSLLGEDRVASVMVELFDPRSHEGGISYWVALEGGGTIPASFGESSLFIDNEAWAAVGGLVAGRRMARRQSEREAMAYQAGASKGQATTAQSPTYYYNAAPPSAPPPPPAPPSTTPPAQPSVTELLAQASAAMTSYAATANEQNREYIGKLVENIKVVSEDYAKVAQ